MDGVWLQQTRLSSLFAGLPLFSCHGTLLPLLLPSIGIAYEDGQCHVDASLSHHTYAPLPPWSASPPSLLCFLATARFIRLLHQIAYPISGYSSASTLISHDLLP